MPSPTNPRGRGSRREMLKDVTCAGALLALSGCSALHPSTKTGTRRSHASDLIARENNRPGTRDWLLKNTRIEPSTKYRCPWIEGYCSRTSVRRGEVLNLYVSTNPPSRFEIEIYRLGYYRGAGGRHMMSLGPFRGMTQIDPAIGAKRLRDCQWKSCAALRIPSNWVSGVYLGKLTSEHERLQSYLIFIVRDDRRADSLFQCSDTTWAAYNRWPDHFALYDDGKKEWYWGPNVQVSFNRPYGKYCQILDAPLSTGSGEFMVWEFPLAYWMEAQGYDVTYISNLDTHADPAGLARAKGFLSVGHDEYYSTEMYQNLRGAIAQGLNVAFLSGNTCCGRIELGSSSTGVPLRSFGRVDYFGPRDEGMMKRFPSMAAFPHHSPAEALLLGARSNVPPCTGGADFICALPEHWIYAGTGMKQDERISG